jgi:hypothetical protein
MAGRIRSIKPEILDDEEASSLSDEAWRLWVSMWLIADDHGNCRAGDRYLASQVWQDSSRSPRVAAVLRELRGARRVELYENGGERFAHIRNWAKHQRIDNAGRPRVNGPDHQDSKPWEGIRGESPRVSEVRRSDQDLRPPTTTNESPAAAPLDLVSSKFDFEAIYAAYPRKLGRKKGLQRCRSAIRTQAKFDALQAAVKHYTAFVAGKDVEFVKHFDSFMSVWEDWVEPQSPPGNAGRATGTPAKPNRPPVLDGPPRHHGEADEDYKARCERWRKTG